VRQVNQEIRNDRFKLAHHRVVARALKSYPGLLDEARDVVRAWKQDFPRPFYVDEWDKLLARPIEEVRREIVRRSPHLNRLRISSPFALTPTKVMQGENLARLRRLSSRLAIAR